MTDKPSRNEEEYFVRREAELLRQRRAAVENAKLEAERRTHYMKCPKCGYDLITGDWRGVHVDQCTHCHGVWLDADEAQRLLKRPDSSNVLSRVFRATMRGVSGLKAES